METPVSADRVRPDVRSSIDKTSSAPADDIVVARRRMRHLAPWDIKPLPMTHRVTGASVESPPPREQREDTKLLGLHLLAVHMWQAAAKTALR